MQGHCKLGTAASSHGPCIPGPASASAPVKSKLRSLALRVQAAQAMSTSYSAWQPKEYGAPEPDPPGEPSAPAQGSADGAPSEGFVFDEATGMPLLMRSKAEVLTCGTGGAEPHRLQNCPSWAVGELGFLGWMFSGAAIVPGLSWGTHAVRLTLIASVQHSTHR